MLSCLNRHGSRCAVYFVCFNAGDGDVCITYNSSSRSEKLQIRGSVLDEDFELWTADEPQPACELSLLTLNSVTVLYNNITSFVIDFIIHDNYSTPKYDYAREHSS